MQLQFQLSENRNTPTQQALLRLEPILFLWAWRKILLGRTSATCSSVFRNEKALKTSILNVFCFISFMFSQFNISPKKTIFWRNLSLQSLTCRHLQSWDPKSFFVLSLLRQQPPASKQNCAVRL